MHTFFKRVGTIISILVGLAALFVLGSLLPIEGNYSFRIVESGSMEPTITTGSVVATIPSEAYSVGDIVTFAGTEINPTPTTHRIVDIEDDMFVAKGDANEDVDYRRVREEEVLGKVFLTVPYAGYVATFFATPNGKAALAVLGILLIACTFVPWRRILKNHDEALHSN